MNRLLFLVLLLPTAACAQKSDSTSAAASVSGDAAAVADDSAFVTACMETSNLGEAICACTARKAREDLSETGYAFLLATLQQDEERAEELRGELRIQEAMQAGMFMVNAPKECAGG